MEINKQESLISECAEIQEIIPLDELEQYAKIEEITAGLNVCGAERLKQNGYTNECFFNSDGSLTEQQKITLKEKQKYFYIDFGTSGAFMVAKEEIKGYPVGSVFNIKAYGTPNHKKHYGTIFNLLPKTLHSLRFDYRR